MVGECRNGHDRTWDLQRRCLWQEEIEKEWYEEEVQPYLKMDYKLNKFIITDDKDDNGILSEIDPGLNMLFDMNDTFQNSSQHLDASLL